MYTIEIYQKSIDHRHIVFDCLPNIHFINLAVPASKVEEIHRVHDALPPMAIRQLLIGAKVKKRG